jgi:hypothetical protein
MVDKVLEHILALILEPVVTNDNSCMCVPVACAHIHTVPTTRGDCTAACTACSYLLLLLLGLGLLLLGLGPMLLLGLPYANSTTALLLQTSCAAAVCSYICWLLHMCSYTPRPCCTAASSSTGVIWQGAWGHGIKQLLRHPGLLLMQQAGCLNNTIPVHCNPLLCPCCCCCCLLGG